MDKFVNTNIVNVHLHRQINVIDRYRYFFISFMNNRKGKSKPT